MVLKINDLKVYNKLEIRRFNCIWLGLVVKEHCHTVATLSLDVQNFVLEIKNVLLIKFEPGWAKYGPPKLFVGPAKSFFKNIAAKFNVRMKLSSIVCSARCGQGVQKYIKRPANQ